MDVVIQQNVSLKNHTTWHVGGYADYFAAVATTDEYIHLLQNPARYNHAPVTLLGNGSNVLIGDKGIRGLVVKNTMCTIKHNPNFILADSGVKLPTLSMYFEKNHWGNMAWAHGIPGTVGGACISNAGAHGNCMADVVLWVEVLQQGKVVRLNNTDCGFTYRASCFSKSDSILKVAFNCTPEPQESITQKRLAFAQYRNATQPKGYSAGSVFKKTPDNQSAGFYIDQAGLKNTRIGGASVSGKHANFIINDGSATATNIAKLIDNIKNTVNQKYGIVLQEETQYLGEF